MKDEPIPDEKLDQLVGGNYRALGGISIYRLIDRLARELQATRTRQVEREQEVVRDIAAALAVPVSSPDGHEDRHLTYAEAIEWVASRSRAWRALLRRMEVADPRWLAQWRGQRWREGNGAPSPGQRRWRIGQSYGIHVYEQSDTTPEGDRPVATFFEPTDAIRAVAAVNRQVGDDDLGQEYLADPVSRDLVYRATRYQLVLDNQPESFQSATPTIYDEIQAERQRAHRKHGVTSMESAPVDEMYRSVILSEEIGEVSEVVWAALWALALSAAGGRVATVMNDGRHAGRIDFVALRKELVQTATMAAAWADRIPRNPVDFVEQSCSTEIQEIPLNYIEKAKEIVFDYVKANLDKTDTHVTFDPDMVYLVWFSKTLQNWKALVSTTLPDGMYYEVTFDGDQNVAYLDAYKKFQNVAIKL